MGKRAPRAYSSGLISNLRPRIWLSHQNYNGGDVVKGHIYKPASLEQAVSWQTDRAQVSNAAEAQSRTAPSAGDRQPSVLFKYKMPVFVARKKP